MTKKLKLKAPKRKRKTKKTFCLRFDVPVIKDKKTKTGYEMPVRYNVRGMMTMIKRAMNTREQQDLLDEYAKFYIMDKLKIKFYPLEK